MIKTCTECGKTFDTQKDDERTRFCSHKCRNHHYYKRLPLRQCVICGDLYHPTHQKQKTGGARCGGILSTREYNKVCVVCGKPFVAKSPLARHCSHECHKKTKNNYVAMRRKVNDIDCVTDGKDGIIGVTYKPDYISDHKNDIYDVEYRKVLKRFSSIDEAYQYLNKLVEVYGWQLTPMT